MSESVSDPVKFPFAYISKWLSVNHLNNVSQRIATWGKWQM